MEDIYINYDAIEQSAAELREHAENVLTDARKLKELLNDLNDYWKSSAATKFTFNTDEFIELMNKFSKEYDELSTDMKNSHDSYKEFDSYFASKGI